MAIHLYDLQTTTNFDTLVAMSREHTGRDPLIVCAGWLKPDPHPSSMFADVDRAAAHTNAIAIPVGIDRYQPFASAEFRNPEDNVQRVILDMWHRAFGQLEDCLAAGGDVWWPRRGLAMSVDRVGAPIANAHMPSECPEAWGRFCQHSRSLFEADYELNFMHCVPAANQPVVVACGGREYQDRQTVNLVLDLMNRWRPVARLIEGRARGADRLAGNWALSRSVATDGVQAEWDRLGPRRAGWARNARMRDMLLHWRQQTSGQVSVVVFPGGRGTKMMVDMAGERGIKVHHALQVKERLFSRQRRAQNVSTPAASDDPGPSPGL